MKWWSRISKIHFVLYKENNLDDSPVLIKDLSRNGTFLNGILIGQNQTRFLKTGDVISVIEEDIKSKCSIVIYMAYFFLTFRVS